MERIGDSVGRELGRTGGGAGRALSAITGVWAQAVGDEVARQAWPLRVGRDGTLHVATSSSTWAFELDRLSPQILERLAALAGNAAPPRIRFSPGPIPEPGAPEEVGGAPAQPFEATPEAEAIAAQVAGAIEDPELRRIVAKAARASLSRAGSSRQI